MQEIATQSAIDRLAREAAFSHWFGLPRREVSILSTLFEAGGEFVPFIRLAGSERINKNALFVRVCNLRTAMECEAIDSIQGQGYRLTEIGLAECRNALESFVTSLSDGVRRIA